MLLSRATPFEIFTDQRIDVGRQGSDRAGARALEVAPQYGGQLFAALVPLRRVAGHRLDDDLFERRVEGWVDRGRLGQRERGDLGQQLELVLAAERPLGE